MDKVIEVKSLETIFRTEAGIVRAVNDVSFSVGKGKTLGIVGESGCGKSVTSLSIMRLVPNPPGEIVGGEILFQGKDLLKASTDEMRAIRGNQISMIFQEPMTSLNPVFTVGYQIMESLYVHKNMSRSEALARTIEMLKLVGIPSPEKRVHDYPHQISGGMRQRVMIAMALACDPQVLIADEPTTALDVTIQAQILELMRRLRETFGMALILITHDLGIVAETADEVLVMYAGKVVEKGAVRQIFADPKHPYTRGLLNSIPSMERDQNREAGAGAMASAGRVRLQTIPGIVPSLTALPKGCPFQSRCGYVMDECRVQDPPLRAVGEAHQISCYKDLEKWKR